jgi:hypothetical protein
MRARFILMALIASLLAITAKAQQFNDIMYQIKNELTVEEQALFDKGAFMEGYSPDKHSCHKIVYIELVQKGKTQKATNHDPVLDLEFGIEDAAPARSEGQSMAEAHYSPALAEQFLFAQGWDKYHDRFFTRAYVQEGLDAFNDARKRR